MSKRLVIPSNLNIEPFSNLVDGYIFGLKSYSVNMPLDIEIEDLKKIKKQNSSKEIFIALNKNIYSYELDGLRQTLKEIDELGLSGILYADTCFINLKKELNLKTSLVWSQEHLTTNYATINFWQEYGVEYTYLSAELTMEEIKEIRKNTTSKLILPIFGYIPMFTSKRHIVKNYLDQFHLIDHSKINYIEKEGKTYPIVDYEEGTVAYTSHILNGIEEYVELSDIDYVTFNSFDIDLEKFIEVLKMYQKKDIEKDLQISNLDKGFLYKETIYKVK